MKSSTIPQSSAMRWITHAAFVLALAVVIARVTTPDALRDPWETAPGSQALPSSPGPGTALVFALLACLPAILILLRNAIDRSFRLKLHWSHLLLFALAGWAVLSTLWASDRFAAAVTSAQFFSAACLLWAMSQLVRSAVRFRVVSALSFGLLLALVVQSALYRYMDVPENITYWHEHKSEILKEHNWPADSFAAKQFEHKLISGELVGFFNSANTFAAMGVLLSAACVGIGFQKLRDREPPGWLALPVIVLISLIWILINARSKTSAVTPFIGVGALGYFLFWRQLLSNRHFKNSTSPLFITARQHITAYWICTSVVVLGILAVIGHGLYHHGLFPGHFSNSLDFRWKYWAASFRIFKSHPLLGVGWNNYGLYYLAHRLPEAAEEIKDPHNFLVRFFVELGIVGGVLCILWLLRCAFEITRPAAKIDQLPSDSDPITMKSVAAFSVLGILLSILANVDFSMQIGDVLALIIKPILYLLTLLLGTMAASMLSQQSWSLDNRRAPLIFYCTVTGLGLFLLHNLIDFSWFETGPMLLFMALIGSTQGMSPTIKRPASQPVIAVCGFIAAVACWLLATLCFVGPIVLAEQSANQANELIRSAPVPQTGESDAHFRHAAQDLETASQLVPYNSDYLFRQAEANLRIGQVDKAESLIAQAKLIDPMKPDAYLLDANVQLSGPNPNPAAVRSDFATLLKLNPNDVSLHIQYGDALQHLGLTSEAREQYRQALSANEALPAEEPKRLPTSQVADLQAKLR